MEMQNFYSFLNKHNPTSTWCTTFKTFHFYVMSGVLELSNSQKRS